MAFCFPQNNLLTRVSRMRVLLAFLAFILSLFPQKSVLRPDWISPMPHFLLSRHPACEATSDSFLLTALSLLFLTDCYSSFRFQLRCHFLPESPFLYSSPVQVLVPLICIPIVCCSFPFLDWVTLLMSWLFIRFLRQTPWMQRLLMNVH